MLSVVAMLVFFSYRCLSMLVYVLPELTCVLCYAFAYTQVDHAEFAALWNSLSEIFGDRVEFEAAFNECVGVAVNLAVKKQELPSTADVSALILSRADGEEAETTPDLEGTVSITVDAAPVPTHGSAADSVQGAETGAPSANDGDIADDVHSVDDSNTIGKKPATGMSESEGDEQHTTTTASTAAVEKDVAGADPEPALHLPSKGKLAGGGDAAAGRPRSKSHLGSLGMDFLGPGYTGQDYYNLREVATTGLTFRILRAAVLTQPLLAEYFETPFELAG